MPPPKPKNNRQSTQDDDSYNVNPEIRGHFQLPSLETKEICTEQRLFVRLAGVWGRNARVQLTARNVAGRKIAETNAMSLIDFVSSVV